MAYLSTPEQFDSEHSEAARRSPGPVWGQIGPLIFANPIFIFGPLPLGLRIIPWEVGEAANENALALVISPGLVLSFMLLHCGQVQGC